MPYYEEMHIPENLPHREFIARESEVLFFLPYFLAQTAIGQTDGGVAGLIETDSRGYDSMFANFGGGMLVTTILEHVSESDIVSRLSNANETPPGIEVFFDDCIKMTKDKIPEIVDAVRTSWFEVLKTTFPEVPPEAIDAHNRNVDQPLKHYLDFEYSYSDRLDEVAPIVGFQR